METIGLIWHEWFDQDVKNAAIRIWAYERILQKE